VDGRSEPTPCPSSADASVSLRDAAQPSIRMIGRQRRARYSLQVVVIRWAARALRIGLAAQPER
jgi:hypothetical protein